MKLRNITIASTVVLTIVMLSSCAARIPSTAKAIDNFDSKKYLGLWYEVARLDHRFERNLDFVTAQYTLKDDGSIRVENKGFNTKKNKWNEAIGKAKLIGPENVGRLKVSFFGPFYSGYNIVALDDEYKYALVVGNTTKYAWLLSRTKSMPDDIKEQYLRKAAAIGVNTQDFIWVNQSK